MKQPEKIDKETAKRKIVESLETCPNAICFFFYEDGTQLLTATDDEAYDQMALGLARSLEVISKLMEHKCD